MKKIFLLFILALTGIECSWGQAYYRFEFDINFKLRGDGFRYYIWDPYLLTSSGNKVQLPTLAMSQQKISAHKTGSVLVPANYGTLKSIIFGTTRQHHTTLGGWNTQCSERDIVHSLPSCITKNTYINWGCFNDAGPVTVNTLAYFPVLDIQRVGSTSLISEDERITINATAGFPSSEYKWVYATVDNPTYWKNVPASCFTNNVFNASAKELLQTNDLSSMHGKDVYIMIDFGCNGKTSNTLTYNVRMSAPRIVTTGSTVTKCHDSSDGSIKVTLDRALKTGEVLNVDYDDFHTIGVSSLESDNSFEINNLPQGTYNIQISGNLNGIPLFSDGADHKKTNVLVTSPPAVTMSTTNSGPITCFQGYDGWIKIIPSGGTGEYTLHWRKGTSGTFTDVPVTGTEKTLEFLSAGSYYIYVTDENGCEGETEIVDLGQPETGISIDLRDMQPISGYGRNDGEITIEIVGGAGTCEWKNASGTTLSSNEVDEYGTLVSTLSNIYAGGYTVYYTATNGCKQQASFFIGQPQELTVSLQSTGIICTDETNGSITAFANGGLPSVNGYEYEWYKVGEFYPILTGYPSISGLGAGSYYVTVTDDLASGSNANITTSNTITLVNPAHVTLTESSDIIETDVSCYGGSNGSARITPHGGAGRYTIHYRKVDGTLAGVTTSPASGIVTIYNLTPGEYHFALKDVSGCEAYNMPADSFKFTIGEPLSAVEFINARVRGTSGYDRTDGSISFQVIGGTPAMIGSDPFYITTWRGPNNSIITEKLDDVIDGVFTTRITNLEQGTYSLTVSDSKGCNPQAVYETVVAPPPLTLNTMITDSIKCNGETTGEFVALADGGLPFDDLDRLPYTYKWYQVVDGIDSLLLDHQTDTLTHLWPGEFKVVVEDSAEPPYQVESPIYTIDEPPLLVTEVTTRNIACYGTNDGFIHIHVSGGVAGYRLFAKGQNQDTDFVEYTFDPIDTTFYLDNLISDKYTVYIIDANDCYAKIEGEEVHDIYLSQPEAPLGVHSIEHYNISGYGLKNGNIKFAVTGGTPKDDHSYNVRWLDKHGFPTIPSIDSLENNQYVTSIWNLSVGEYTVKITDKNFALASTGKDSTCFFTQTFTITEPDELIAKLEETHFVSCYGMSDGQLVVSVTGGVPEFVANEPVYKYSWYKENRGVYTELTNQKDAILNNMPAGNYRVIVEDYSWLPNRDTVDYTLVQPERLLATATNVEIICGQVIDVTVTVTGGTPPYRYEWSTGDTIQSLPAMVAGKYMVFVTDSRGCQTTALAQVRTPSDLAIAETLHNPLCYQGSNGSIELNITGGTAPYSYKWSTGATTKTLSGVPSGTYSVIVSDRNNCSLYQSFTLTDPAPISVYIGEDRILCKGQKLVLAPVVDDPKSKFSWSGPDGFTANESSVTVDKEGTYRLTITDSNGCQATDEMNVTVRDFDISSEIVVASQVFVGDTIVVVNISDPMPESSEWLITASDSLEIVGLSDHSAQVIFKYPGYYSIGLRTFVDDCYEDNMKAVSVTTADTRGAGFFGESIIKKFGVYPNPNNGVFTVDVELTQVSAIRLRIVDIGTGIVLNDTRYNGEKVYAIPYNILLASAVYAILLETDSGYMTIKMIIK
jgi:hypothetical protein